LRTIALLLTLVVFLAAPAYSFEWADTHAGVKGGVNIANLNTDPSDAELGDSLPGYSLGAWWAVPVNRSMSIRPEALFTLKGDREKASSADATIKMSYIEVPVLATMSFLQDAKTQPSLFLGPSVGFNVAAKSKVADIETDVKDQTETVEFGLVVGGGLDFKVGEKNSVGLDLRYNLGLTDVANTDTGTSTKNQGIAILGTIGFQ